MSRVPIEVVKFRQEKVYEYWKNQGIVKPKEIREKLKQEWNIEVSEKTVRFDLQDLEEEKRIKIPTKEETTEKRREIVIELYGQRGLTGEKLRQETNKRLEEEFGIPFSFSMTLLEKDIRFLKDTAKVTEEAKEQQMKQTYLEKIEEDLKKVEELTKDGKTIKQIAKIVGIHEETVKDYRKILREQGRLTGKEKPRRQATIKKEKRMKRVNNNSRRNEGITAEQLANKEGVSITTIKRDRKRIKEASPELFIPNQNEQERKSEIVELIELGEKNKSKIADTVDVSLKTIKKDMRELIKEGKIVDRKQLEMQVMKLSNEGLTDNEIRKKLGEIYNKEITLANIKYIVGSTGIRIKRLCKQFDGESSYLEQFEEYIFGCRKRLEKGVLKKEELAIVKDIVMLTEKYQHIIFYLKAAIRLEELEEALKMINYQTNNECFTKEERKEIASLREEVQLLIKSNIAKQMLKKGFEVEEVRNSTGLLETQVLKIRRKLIQEKEEKARKTKKIIKHNKDILEK